MVVDDLQLGIGQKSVVGHVDAEVKEEEYEVVVVVDVVVEVAVRNYIYVIFARNQSQHDEVGRAIAEVEHVLVQPIVGNLAKDVNEDVLYESGDAELLAQIHHTCELRFARGAPSEQVLGKDLVGMVLKQQMLGQAIVENVAVQTVAIIGWLHSVFVGIVTENLVDKALGKVPEEVVGTIERYVETQKMIISKT